MTRSTHIKFTTTIADVLNHAHECAMGDFDVLIVSIDTVNVVIEAL